MIIHVVRPGDTLFKLAVRYRVPMANLLADNPGQLPARLVPGQALVVRFPQKSYVVRSGDSLSSISKIQGLSPQELLQNNPQLQGRSRLSPGQRLVLSDREEKQGTLWVNGCAQPLTQRSLICRVLPALSSLAAPAYAFTPSGELIPPEDSTLYPTGERMGTVPVLVIKNQTAGNVLQEPGVPSALAREIARTAAELQARAVLLDLPGTDSGVLSALAGQLRLQFAQTGVLIAAVRGPDDPPQCKGADLIVLRFHSIEPPNGPPGPIWSLRRANQKIELAIKVIPPQKLLVDLPAYGWDWTLPYPLGGPPMPVAFQSALSLAGDHRSTIRFDSVSQTPWFRYTDERGREHVLWFWDARSMRSALSAFLRYPIQGVNIDLTHPLGQSQTVLCALCRIAQADTVPEKQTQRVEIPKKI